MSNAGKPQARIRRHGHRAARAALREEPAGRYTQKLECDRDALEQRVSYAVSGLCRCKVLLVYFSEEVEGFEKCYKCDHCLNPPVLAAIKICNDEFDHTGDESEPAPPFEPGGQLSVPAFDAGTDMSVAADPVTIAFSDLSARTVLAALVTPA